ncbi:4'-phosphopantetheinyl transferase superfamily protein [Streptomyces sp. S3(2020)]|uniref:4'-phosphopantetheinyl transferase family protein n=1 Tax=Streptomyces sp. S3(2020) TaxID=2732044 RepID=UPI00321710C7
MGARRAAVRASGVAAYGTPDLGTGPGGLMPCTALGEVHEMTRAEPYTIRPAESDSPALSARPSLGEPIAVTSGGADWSRLRADLRRHGTALVHGRLADWRLPPGEESLLREVLGRDLPSYLSLGDVELRARYAASRRLLKSAAAAALGVRPAELELTYGPTGRPSLRGFDQIDISLSHTGDLLLVGLTSRGLIGVDVELAARQLYRRSLKRHICTPQESRDLERLPQEDRNVNLVRLWTLKEAYSKAIGQGMAFRFTEFGFGPGDKPVRVNRPDGRPGTGAQWSFGTYSVDAGGAAFVMSAAVHDTGLGRTLDTDVATMLDAQTVTAITGALAALG